MAEVHSGRTNQALVALLGREEGVPAVRDHLRQLSDLERGIAERRQADVRRVMAANQDPG